MLRTEAVEATTSEKSDVGSGGSGRLVELRLQPIVSEVAGRVVGSDGRAIAGAKVTLGNHDVLNTSFSTSTDGGGGYSIRNVPPGNYHFDCEADGHAKLQRGHTKIRGAMADANFALPRAGTILGRAMLPPNVPTRGYAIVSTTEPNTDYGEPASGGLTNTYAIVNGNGTYRLIGLLPGTYTLYLRVEGKIADRVTVTVHEAEEAPAPEMTMK